jgi:hypothetical protein
MRFGFNFLRAYRQTVDASLHTAQFLAVRKNFPVWHWEIDFPHISGGSAAAATGIDWAPSDRDGYR